jgi:hypothetical protein
MSSRTLHDICRTFGTRLARLKVPYMFVERMLNHKLGSIGNQPDGAVSAVAEVYNRHLYLEEMRRGDRQMGGVPYFLLGRRERMNSLAA